MIDNKTVVLNLFLLTAYQASENNFAAHIHAQEIFFKLLKISITLIVPKISTIIGEIQYLKIGGKLGKNPWHTNVSRHIG